MDLHDIYSEVVELRKDLKVYHAETVTNKTDLQWVKRVVIGGFGFIFTVLGGLIVGAFGAH